MSPMKHLLDNYYDILAPQVSTHLSNDDYAALFTLYKVIYPNYVSRHYVQEISDFVVATFFSRCSSSFSIPPLYPDQPGQVCAEQHAGHHLGHLEPVLPSVAIPPNLSLLLHSRLHGNAARELRQHCVCPPHEVRTAGSQCEPRGPDCGKDKTLRHRLAVDLLMQIPFLPYIL